MKYEGPLYGKVGRKYIPLKQTSKDFDDAEKIMEVMKAEIEQLRKIVKQVTFMDVMEKAIAEQRL